MSVDYDRHASVCSQCREVDNGGAKTHGAYRCNIGAALLKAETPKCLRDDCTKVKAEYARRLRYQRRKMEAEDRERERILGSDRDKRDNQFLKDCGIAPVTFDKGRIVAWKGLLCMTKT